MRYASLCAIARDETPYLEEWIQYHALIGFERIYVYDNESAVPAREILAPYVDSGLVRVEEIAGRGPQREAYQRCLDDHGPGTRWLAFLDVDEFLVPRRFASVQALLYEYEEYGGLGINWVCYGSNGYVDHPPAPIIGRLTRRFPLSDPRNQHIKTIVQPRRVASAFESPHCFVFKPGYFCVNEDGLPLYGNYSPVSVTRVRINHYLYRSQRLYQEKLDRWENNHEPRDRDALWEDFYGHFAACGEDDPILAPQAARLASLRSLKKPGLFGRLAGEYARALGLEEYLDRAGRALVKGERDEAMRILAMAGLSHDGQSLDLCAARVHLEAGEHDRAMGRLRRALARGYSLEAYPILFELFVKTGRPDRARGVLDYMERMTRLFAETGVPFSQGLTGYPGQARRLLDLLESKGEES